jgi:hypothetical protein
MGVTKAAIKELEDATSALWGAMRDIRDYRAAPAWKQREEAPDLARAQAQATEARRTCRTRGLHQRHKENGCCRYQGCDQRSLARSPKGSQRRHCELEGSAVSDFFNIG